MDYNYINIALESFCLIICLFLLLYQTTTKKKEKNHNWFTYMIVSNSFMLLGDIIDKSIGGIPGAKVYYTEFVFTIVIYYIASGTLLLSIFGWMYSYIELREKISPWWMRISIALTVIQALIAVTMPIHKIVYINENNYYSRGNYFWITMIFPYITYLMTLIIWFSHFKAFHKSERAYLTIFLTIPVIAQICQIIDGNLLIFNVAVTLCLIILILFIQEERERENNKRLNQLITHEKEKLEDVQKTQESLNSQLIDVLCGAVEAKDFYTRGHSLRVAQYAREIMYRLGGDEKAQQDVYRIGILHDVGKISIRDEIINKKGRLTDAEYDEIKMHTIAGYQILRGVDIIPDLAVGARWHHERYDGTGYPNGLSGDNIPLIARIISVADAYDAMTSNRSYHSIMSQADVRKQIEDGMGTQFDPKIAQIMLDMIDDDLQYEMKQNNFNHIINILLIDDDSFVHNMVDRILSNENYLITFANSGEEGIELLKENKYDLCLLDMEMPGMNGFEVLDWIQKNVRKIKIIFLTGNKDMETIKKSEQLGAVDYLTKPINARILKESISSVLAH